MLALRTREEELAQVADELTPDGEQFYFGWLRDRMSLAATSSSAVDNWYLARAQALAQGLVALRPRPLDDLEERVLDGPAVQLEGEQALGAEVCGRQIEPDLLERLDDRSKVGLAVLSTMTGMS